MNLSDTDQAPYSAPTPQTATVSDEAVHAAEAQFTSYFINNYPKDCIIYNPAWHAPKIFRAAKAAMTENIPHLALSAAPCSVEVKKLPCDVQLPGAIFKRGVSISTLITALERREYWPDVLTHLTAKPVDVAAVREQAFEEAKQAITDLPTGKDESEENGHEDAYRAIEALSPAEPVDQWQDMKALSELSKLTYAIQHNPNCPDRYLVRLPGKAGIDLKPYGNAAFRTPNQTNDILGFGKTLHEAYTAATAVPTRKGGE